MSFLFWFYVFCEKSKTEEASVDEALGYAISHIFWNDEGIMITCYLRVENDREVIQTGEYQRAEELVSDNFELLSEKRKKETQIKQTILAGKEVYYYLSRYRNISGKFQTIFSACEVEPEKIFEFDLTCSSWSRELSMENFEEFFYFE